jgi:N-hydroxyarylamine O-acetyltransferase
VTARPRPSELSNGQVEAYLERIGIEAPALDAEGLRRLQVAHLDSVPFENLDIHLGVPIVLDVDAFVEKIAVRRRGGFCYELNGAFASLLETLGFSTTLLEARVPGSDGTLGIRFDHLCLRVDLDRPFLIDVGFGECFREPLLLEPGLEQVDPAGTFTIVERDDGSFDVEGSQEVLYRFFPEPRALVEFEPGSDFNQTSPDSHFTRRTVCTLPSRGGRVTISGSTLIVTEGDRRTMSRLSDDELLAAYRERFGIELDRVPAPPPRAGRP